MLCRKRGWDDVWEWLAVQVDEGLKSVIRDYESRLRTFVALLPAQTPVDLNFLLFRLDTAVTA